MNFWKNSLLSKAESRNLQPTVVGTGRTPDNVEEKALVARDGEFGVSRGEVILVASFVKQCLEERVIEQADFDDKPFLLLPNVHHQVTLRDVLRNRIVFLVRHKGPQTPILATIFTPRARTHFTTTTTSNVFPPLVNAHLHHILSLHTFHVLI